MERWSTWPINIHESSRSCEPIKSLMDFSGGREGGTEETKGSMSVFI